MSQTLILLITFFTLFLTLATSLEYPQDLLYNTLFEPLEPPTISIPPASSSSSSSYQSLSFLFFPSPSPSPSLSLPLPLSDQKTGRLLVPALFVLGDSSVDAGNNNYLASFARADRLPYGRDFDTHSPTGRFSNGRIPVDYLALRLGLPLVPSYLEQAGSIEDMIHGVNYASAGAGIIFSSGSDLGQRISFIQQIQQLTDTFQQFMMSMGEDKATNLISRSIFYISIGTNDYIHHYLRNVSGIQSMYTPWGFNTFLAATLKQEIRNLYVANVRKVVLMGLAPMGCAPHYLWRYRSKNGECIKDINNMIMEFNFLMRYLVEQLNQELPDAMIIFCDVYEGSMDIIQNHERYGFSNTTDACCGLGKYNGWIMCLAPEMACRNASTHIWWDQFHPTEAVNKILAENVWSGQHSSMCYPTNMKDLVDPVRL